MKDTGKLESALLLSQNGANDLEEFRSRINHVKVKYENLINLSNCYSKSFLNLDNLSKLIEDFSIDLNKIEGQLAAQSYIEIGNLNQMSNEIDIVSVSC